MSGYSVSNNNMEVLTTVEVVVSVMKHTLIWNFFLIKINLDEIQ